MIKQGTIILKYSIIFILIFGTALMLLNMIVIGDTMGQIVADATSQEDNISNAEIQMAKEFESDCIIVLGASVHSDGTPSPMLAQRLDIAIKLYEEGVAPALLMSGDNATIEYNELKVMAQYAEEKGVPQDSIFCDYAGFSTYETVYRAKKIFKVKKAVIVTQKYHLYRAIYGCNRMGIEAIGIGADQKIFPGQFYRTGRELLARPKDCIKWMIKAKPKYLGDEIPIRG